MRVRGKAFQESKAAGQGRLAVPGGLQVAPSYFEISLKQLGRKLRNIRPPIDPSVTALALLIGHIEAVLF